MRLIASWTPDQDPSTEMPTAVKWEDGTPATLDDFAKHQLDTYTLRTGRDGGMERHIFPSISVEVVYDWFAKDWVMKGSGVITAALELHNPDATDVQITAELFTFPVVYRANIVRTPAVVV
jgi:hypothetical protein